MGGGFFTSEDMQLCHLLLHVDFAFENLIEVGHEGLIHFNKTPDDYVTNDMYTGKLLICNELLRSIYNLESEMDELNIKMVYYPNVDIENKPKETDIVLYAKVVNELNAELIEVTKRYNDLDARKFHLIEWRYSLIHADNMLTTGGKLGSELIYSDSILALLIQDQTQTLNVPSKLGYIVGTIKESSFVSFELLMFRLFHHNLLLRHVELPERVRELVGTQLEPVRKYVIFIITNSSAILPKVIRCCNAYHVTIFECPERRDQRQDKISSLGDEINQMESILTETRKAQRHLLSIAASDIFIWKINVRKAKMVYFCLNHMSIVGLVKTQKYLQADCFVPVADFQKARTVLNRNMKPTPGEVEIPALLLKRSRKPKHKPPTYFRTNKFTKGFQNLIDSYGFADYKELNPAPYTIITFPFLFAIMFGDIGHGIILTVFAMIMVIKEKKMIESRRTAKTESEIVSILFSGRYIILLMGIFSIYIGFIYNDMFSLPLNIFGSSWKNCIADSDVTDLEHRELVLDPSNPVCYTGDPYPIGMDPLWKVSGEDAIITFNSLKMKLAITLGISQMIFGISLSAYNCINLNKKVDLFFVVIPQFIFLSSLFCYLVFLIFLKWITYGGHHPPPHSSACAPSILITFIDMMLMKSSAAVPNCPKGMYPGEKMVEYCLVVLAFSMVPILLLGKPIYLMRQRKKTTKTKERDLSTLQVYGRENLEKIRSSRYSFDSPKPTSKRQAMIQQLAKKKVEEEVEHDMSEIWIHSGIHTIETVLGSVSHTASYLRLWALSLAHEQLAHVLWNMVLARGLHNTSEWYIGSPILALYFIVWAILTVAILVMMEGLSAFLHTLRLHWVEFQSKFYSGTGENFHPFQFPPSNLYD